MNTFDKYRLDKRSFIIIDLLKDGPIVVDGVSFDCRVDVEFRKGPDGVMSVHDFEMGDVYVLSGHTSFLLDQAHLKTANKYLLEQIREDIRKLAFDKAQLAPSYKWESLDEAE